MSEPLHSAQPLTAQDVEDRVVDGSPDPGPPCLAAIDSVADGDRMIVTVRGELDFGGRRLRPALHDVLGRSATGLDLDLTAVGFCDCGGLNVLLDLRRRAFAQGKTVAVRACSPVVERLLDLTGTRELFAPPASDGPDVVRGSGPDRLDAVPGSVPEGRSRHKGVDQELRTEVAQLRRAMRTRPDIDLARGILMATFGLSAEAAWTVLVTASQNTNTKLHHLARDLMGTVDGAPLSEAVRQQMAAAVAKVQDGPPVSPGGVPEAVVPESHDAPPCT
ncbi:ANTAR domain-containing protein [Streptomyces fulvoviolaceus]|uniref:ANTAR domain-containing protein n=1 Tax=Streptomyces fulvoviolaceus TaxID=285535 RepID=UPI0007C4952E|nr:ANTAR domain-containing protein [Streptomyces fulvoviolaceus]MCT9076133.1 ANTAR domain-containing protein [Streptomyces fulvoviolaceus]